MSKRRLPARPPKRIARRPFARPHGEEARLEAQIATLTTPPIVRAYLYNVEGKPVKLGIPRRYCDGIDAKGPFWYGEERAKWRVYAALRVVQTRQIIARIKLVAEAPRQQDHAAA